MIAWGLGFSASAAPSWSCCSATAAAHRHRLLSHHCRHWHWSCHLWKRHLDQPQSMSKCSQSMNTDPLQLCVLQLRGTKSILIQAYPWGRSRTWVKKLKKNICGWEVFHEQGVVILIEASLWTIQSTRLRDRSGCFWIMEREKSGCFRKQLNWPLWYMATGSGRHVGSRGRPAWLHQRR